MNKGNPVPSLDKINKLINEYKDGKRTHLNTLYEIEKVLQNGVETNKEQPFFGKDDTQLDFTKIKHINYQLQIDAIVKHINRTSLCKEIERLKR